MVRCRSAMAIVVLVLLAAVAGAATFSVTSTADTDHAYPAGTCPDPCTLRDAIDAANASAGADTIAFNIPGAGPFTISPLTPLPYISDQVVIDGYTQPGTHANTFAAGSDAVLLVELSGEAGGDDASTGLYFAGSASHSVLRGLVVDSFAHDGIVIAAAAGVSVGGCYVGIDPGGTTARTNDWRGILVYDQATDTVIGGLTPADRNVISGNSTGIGIGGSGDMRTTVVGNYIGTDPSGTTAIANSEGIGINTSDNNVIGGATTAARNVISGNGTAIALDNPSSGNRVVGNVIGTDASGKSALPNTQAGVGLYDGYSGTASGNTVGGLAPGEGNVIAYNVGPGVVIENYQSVPCRRDAILGNSIHDNAGLAIDLGGDGVTPNDPGDADDGPNGLQNYPVITSAARTGSLLQLCGTLDSTPGGSFTVQLFADRACDASGYGQAERLLATLAVQTDGNGHGSFTTTLGPVAALGEAITATATDADGNTSELSACHSVAHGVLRRRLPPR
jgi:CSLREA domain-containing protein